MSQKFTINGYVRDGENEETLIGANASLIGKDQGTATNNYGFFSLTLESDTVHIAFSYVGFQSQTISFFLERDTTIIVHLQSVVLSDIVINTDRNERIQESSRMSTFKIPVYQIKRMPSLMGENDVIKILQLLPGVQGGAEGSSGLYVRGGGPDQNLILLDGVPIYNASHLYGFFSTFNADAINHVELVKGGFPARYGGRLSSVVDINMKEGSLTGFHGQATLGIISSKVVLEGPIKKDKVSFIISARRSYLNLLKSSIFNQSDVGVANNYFFYDLNAKVNYKINARNRVYFSYYSGIDKAGTKSQDQYITTDVTFTTNSSSRLEWGNSIGAFRWNHVYNKKIFSNLTATYSKYHFQIFNETQNIRTTQASGATENIFYQYNYKSGIRDFSGRIDFDFIPNPSHYIRFGASGINHRFTPGVLALKSSEAVEVANNIYENIEANELSAYIEDDWDITSRIKINAGIHASTFLVEGENYPSIQPRVSARYLVTPSIALKASYATMQQNIHLLTNAGIGLPTDLWVPATKTVSPQTSSQGAIGFAYDMKGDYEISLETYYKKMHRLIEYKDGANYLSTDQNWQTKIESGSGESYGTELFLQKKVGKINGWVGYTLSWNYRQFANLNHGEKFPYRYDRRHDAKIALSYLVNKKFNVGLIWIYSSGNAVTLPLQMYSASPDVTAYNASSPSIWYYDARNNFRMRAYHRLDLNASYSIVRKWGEHRLTLSIFDVYARKNPFYLQLGYYKNERALIQVNLLSILPSLSYTIQF